MKVVTRGEGGDPAVTRNAAFLPSDMPNVDKLDCNSNPNSVKTHQLVPKL